MEDKKQNWFIGLFKKSADPDEKVFLGVILFLSLAGVCLYKIAFGKIPTNDELDIIKFLFGISLLLLGINPTTEILNNLINRNKK